MRSLIVDVVIPAYNEEQSIGMVLSEIPDFVRNVVVCDNNSTDGTAAAVVKGGAILVAERQQGYGSACLKAVDHIRKTFNPPDVLVFLDADHSDFPAQMSRHLEAIQSGADLVIGSRTLGKAQKGSLMPQQIFGNALATFLLRVIYKSRFTDLGPFRAIRWPAYESLGMQDKNFGWTVEMQVKALKKGLKCCEVPVDYRKRIGKSKIAGTLKGTFLAGIKIISTILRNV